MATACGVRAIITKRACARLTLLLTLLVGGAIINVAVAWSCAIWLTAPASLERIRGGFVPLDAPVWQCVGWDRTGATRVASWPFADVSEEVRQAHSKLKCLIVEDSSRSIPGWMRIADASVDSSNDKPRIKVEDARGWPALSMKCWFGRLTILDIPQLPDVAVYWGIELPDGSASVMSADRHRALPLRPLWPGFAINTVFYAFVLWLLFTAPFALRRRSRVKRGLCVKCAYDLRGHPPSTTSDVCPECGAAVGGCINGTASL